MRKKIILLVFILICNAFFSFSLPASAKEKNTNLQLSANERIYLEKKRTLKVSVITEMNPISYVDKEQNYQGLPIQILNKIEEESGIHIIIIPAKSYEESLEQLQTGKTDLIALFTRYQSTDIKHKEEKICLLPYLTSQAVLIHHKNLKLNKMEQIILADISGREKFTEKKNVSIICYPTHKQALNAVRCGQADTAICDCFTGNFLMNEYALKDLVLIPSTVMMEQGFGLLPNTDHNLISILNKSIDCFTNGERNRILMEGNKESGNVIQKFVYRYPFEIICFLIALMFVTTLILLAYTKIKIHQHQTFQGYEESYRMLSDAFGEAGMEYDYQKDTLTVFGEKSNLDIQEKVEDFKENLQQKAIRISLTPEQFERIIQDGIQNKSFSTELQCGVKSGEWVWYRLIYTVIATTESHKRPIRLVGCLTNIDGEHAERERLMKLSSNDQLTGLLNHSTAEKIVSSLLEQEETRIWTLAIMDIDYFKSFNDNKGHLCGDAVLRQMGIVLRDIFGRDDILCRWGGDEFMIFLVDETSYGKAFSKKIELFQKRMRAYYYQGEACPVTLSIGGANSYPGCTMNTLFQQADDALYHAKEHGKDQFWLYAPTEQIESLQEGEMGEK
ncbi:MAG: GGDEF domain-containing protein [Lachnospiraceae bacterium]